MKLMHLSNLADLLYDKLHICNTSLAFNHNDRNHGFLFGAGQHMTYYMVQWPKLNNPFCIDILL